MPQAAGLGMEFNDFGPGGGNLPAVERQPSMREAGEEPVSRGLRLCKMLSRNHRADRRNWGCAGAGIVSNVLLLT